MGTFVFAEFRSFDWYVIYGTGCSYSSPNVSLNKAPVVVVVVYLSRKKKSIKKSQSLPSKNDLGNIINLKYTLPSYLTILLNINLSVTSEIHYCIPLFP